MNNLDKHRFIVNASVIIRKDGNVLVMKRSMLEDSNPGKYGLPGGKLDHTDTTLEEGVMREAWEEVGLRIKNLQYFESHILETDNGQKLYVTFTADFAGGMPALDPKEVESVLWYSKEMLEEMNEDSFTKGTHARVLASFDKV